MFQKTKNLGPICATIVMCVPCPVFAGYGAESKGKGGVSEAESPKSVSASATESATQGYALMAADLNGAAISPAVRCVDAAPGDTLTVEIRGCGERDTNFGSVILQLSEDAEGTFSFCMDEPGSAPSARDCGCLTINVSSLHGDVDGSGVIDLDDLTCVLRCFETSGAQCPEGDVTPCDGDGVCDIDDIVIVLRALEGG